MLFTNGEKILALVIAYLTSCSDKLRVIMEHVDFVSDNAVSGTTSTSVTEEDCSPTDSSPFGDLLSISSPSPSDTAKTSSRRGGGSGDRRPFIEVISSSTSDELVAHVANDENDSGHVAVPVTNEPDSGKGGQDDALQETGRELDEICEACTTCLAIVDAVITLGSSEGKVRTTREEACIDSCYLRP